MNISQRAFIIDRTIWFKFFKFLELWTATKYARIINLTKVRWVLKTSFRWLLNGVQEILWTVNLWPKVDEFWAFCQKLAKNGSKYVFLGVKNIFLKIWGLSTIGDMTTGGWKDTLGPK